ncbi:hypothetical protein [Methylocystis rosea]|uniref:Uncharacterized protein n=1 Tax=Methylocystis rosea TaxID=173366 RepID=A0A3G8MA61_9HYPH|nr:hypothetical protein [Methylocystis rosea]AZG78757.1 hypothetical protein EHO51_18110 [Methylocystis rosea]
MKHIAIPSRSTMRMMARAGGYDRQSQNPAPQADARIFCRRFAPLTPPRRHAVSIALARYAKEVVMSAASVIALLIPFTAGAQQPESHRLFAESFSLTTSNLQTRIWSDQLPALLSGRKHLQAAAPDANIGLTGLVYETQFKVDRRVYVVSVLNHQCANTGLEHSLSCPARIAEISGSTPRLIQEVPNFVVSFQPDATGTKTNAQSGYMTIASFDPATRALTFTDVSDGQQTALPIRINLE